MATYYRTPGNDSLTGGQEADTLYGYSGHDTLFPRSQAEPREPVKKSELTKATFRQGRSIRI
jgi:hypothetical protein